MCERHYRRQLHRGTTDDPRINNLTRYEVNDGDCHIWQGPTYANGYGKMSTKVHGTRLPHRAAYIEHIGSIPLGLDVDHRCHRAPCVRGPACPHRLCMNPAHLEPVTRIVNLARGDALRTRCGSGRHDITIPGALAPGTRQCLKCRTERARRGGRARTARMREAREAASADG